MISNKANNLVKYDRVFSLPEEEVNKLKNKPNSKRSMGNTPHHNQSQASHISEDDNPMNNTNLNRIKFSNINETDKDNDEDEDVDFQGLSLRKYLESKNIISVMKPDNNPDKIGKKSKLDYVKEIAYYNQELNKLNWKDVIKESNKRLIKKEIKEKAREEVYKQLKEEGEEFEEELYVDKSEDSFEKKKNEIREKMGKNSENILLPPLLINQKDAKYKGKDIVFIDK